MPVKNTTSHPKFQPDLSRLEGIREEPLVRVVSEVSRELGLETYIIGGYVRDRLLGREVKDIDFVTLGGGIQLARAVGKALGDKPVHVFKRFGTAMIKEKGFELEFVGTRKESYRSDSRKPIVEDGSFQDDLDRRDFTINALAIPLHAAETGLLDPFGGMADLESGVIRTPKAPEQTYADDPLRMMRAVRFATQLGFRVEEESFAAIRSQKERIRIVSQERITDELNKIISAPVPSSGFKALESTGILGIIFPEMIQLKGIEKRKGIAHKDNFYHTLQVLDNISVQTDELYLRWAAILHDIAKPATKRFQEGTGWTFHGHEDRGARMVPKIFQRMKLPMDHKMKYVQKLVRLHLRPIALTKEEITDSAIRRLLFDAGDELEDLMILCRADITSKNDRKVQRYLKNYDLVIKKLEEVEEKDRIRSWQPPISGEEIMSTFGIGPGRNIGIIKNSIKEAILDGDIPNDYESAKEHMLALGRELGLEPTAHT